MLTRTYYHDDPAFLALSERFRIALKAYDAKLTHASFIHADDWAASNGTLGTAYACEREAADIRAAATVEGDAEGVDLEPWFRRVSAERFIGGTIRVRPIAGEEA